MSIATRTLPLNAAIGLFERISAPVAKKMADGMLNKRYDVTIKCVRTCQIAAGLKLDNFISRKSQENCGVDEIHCVEEGHLQYSTMLHKQAPIVIISDKGKNVQLLRHRTKGV